MSGFVEHALLDKMFVGAAAHLQKPFTPESLASSVRAVLDART